MGSQEALKGLSRRMAWYDLHFNGVILAALQGQGRGRETCLEADAVIQVDGEGEGQQVGWGEAVFYLYFKEEVTSIPDGFGVLRREGMNSQRRCQVWPRVG